MLIHKLFAPADDLNGAAGADPAAGAGPVGDAAGEPGPSLEDTARETYRTLMSQEEGAEGETDTDEQTPSGKQRGADGKFVKAAGEQAAKPDGEQQPPAEDQQLQQTQAKPHDAYPNTWRKELNGEWAKLPEPVRAEIHKREQDFHNGVKQYRDAAGFGAAMAQEMLPYQQIMREKGVTPQGIVRDIMASLKEMVTGSEESKAQVFLKLASDYGINFDTVLSLRQRAPGPAAPDLSPVLQRVQQIETRITQADQERERQLQQEEDARVTAFLNDAKNEHARAVAPQMKALLLSGQAQDLADAYEQAIWVHPETRAKLLAKQEAERRKKEADEAAAARKAASANVHRRGTPPAPAKAGSLEDTARSVYRKLNG